MITTDLSQLKGYATEANALKKLETVIGEKHDLGRSLITIVCQGGRYHPVVALDRDHAYCAGSLAHAGIYVYCS